MTEKQFVALWVKSYNTMVSTGDTQQFLKLATPECDTCTTVADQVQNFYKDGGSMQGGLLFHLRNIRPNGMWDRQEKFDFRIDTTAAKVVTTTGEVVKTYPRSKDDSYSLVLKPSGDAWKVIHVARNLK